MEVYSEEGKRLEASHTENWLSMAGAVELRNEIGRAVGMSLPGTLVFDYPNIAAISAFLHQKMPNLKASADHADSPPALQQFRHASQPGLACPCFRRHAKTTPTTSA